MEISKGKKVLLAAAALRLIAIEAPEAAAEPNWPVAPTVIYSPKLPPSAPSAKEAHTIICGEALHGVDIDFDPLTTSRPLMRAERVPGTSSVKVRLLGMKASGSNIKFIEDTTKWAGYTFQEFDLKKGKSVTVTEVISGITYSLKNTGTELSVSPVAGKKTLPDKVAITKGKMVVTKSATQWILGPGKASDGKWNLGSPNSAGVAKATAKANGADLLGEITVYLGDKKTFDCIGFLDTTDKPITSVNFKRPLPGL